MKKGSIILANLIALAVLILYLSNLIYSAGLMQETATLRLLEKQKYWKEKGLKLAAEKWIQKNGKPSKTKEFILLGSKIKITTKDVFID